jgi:hypothetical protein
VTVSNSIFHSCHFEITPAQSRSKLGPSCLDVNHHLRARDDPRDLASVRSRHWSFKALVDDGNRGEGYRKQPLADQRRQARFKKTKVSDIRAKGDVEVMIVVVVVLFYGRVTPPKHVSHPSPVGAKAARG